MQKRLKKYLNKKYKQKNKNSRSSEVKCYQLFGTRRNDPGTSIGQAQGVDVMSAHASH